MNLKNTLISITLLAGGLAVSADAAKAASFTSNIDYTNPTESVWLNSITQTSSITQNGVTFDNFSFVNRTEIIFNTPRTDDPNSGAASTDRGDNVFTPEVPEEAPDNEAITAFLGTNNLNNIIDTEDSGSFDLNVYFDKEIKADNSGLDSLFVWERGMNSDLGIQAIDADGKVIGNPKKITETRNNSAGFQINTGEIGSAQNVGSWGVSLQELGVSSLSGVKLTANGSFKGPDFKIVARTAKRTPEPTTILGLGAVAGMAFLSRRQKGLKKSAVKI